MINKNTLIKARNRCSSAVGYRIPDMGNLRRQFQPNEEKEITMEELRKLSYVRGGAFILKNCLLLDNQEAIDELINGVEPEYFYTEKDIETLLLHGSLDAFLDCLDFAPSGVIDIIKEKAVKLKISDINKRKAILEKTGFNVTKAIEINEETAENESVETQTRRVQTVNASNAPTRRAPASKYKITTLE